jgi:hypothetical protein
MLPCTMLCQLYETSVVLLHYVNQTIEDYPITVLYFSTIWNTQTNFVTTISVQASRMMSMTICVRFSELFHSGFLFATVCLKKFSIVFPKQLLLVHWLEKWRRVGGKKTTFMCFDNVSVTRGFLGVLLNTSKTLSPYFRSCSVLLVHGAVDH